jgi:glycosyltransferase involved in cell wall biosynthesis
MEIARKQVAVIVPIYNAEKYLVELIARIARQIPRQNIIAINDASQDSSARICEDLQIQTINFPLNRGKGAALQAGFHSAIEQGFSHAFSIDSDLQHLPEDIPRFLQQLEKTEADLIIGRRQFSLKSMPWPRIFSNTTTSKIVSWVSKTKIYDSQSGYRLYHLDPLKKMIFRSQRYQFETEIILKLAKKKCKFSFVEIDTIYTDQVSYISHFRDIANFIKIVCYELFHK